MTRTMTSIARMIATKGFKKIAFAALGVMALAPVAQAHDHFGFDFHGNHGQIGIGFNIVAPAPAPVVVPTTRVWVEPVYRTESARVWVRPVTQDVCDRVWVDATYETRDVVHYSRGWRTVVRENVCVVPGHYEDRHHSVLVTDGHFENVDRQVLVTPGHWEDRVVVQAPCN
jgi:hypothetical protein